MCLTQKLFARKIYQQSQSCRTSRLKQQTAQPNEIHSSVRLVCFRYLAVSTILITTSHLRKVTLFSVRATFFSLPAWEFIYLLTKVCHHFCHLIGNSVRTPTFTKLLTNVIVVISRILHQYHKFIDLLLF